jgi:hypothetical protein
MTHKEIINMPIQDFYEGLKKWADVQYVKGETLMKQTMSQGIPVGEITMLYGRSHSKSLFQSYYEHLLKSE